MHKQVLDHGYCTLIETWGSDERIIEAARMSTSKGFLGWGTDEKPGDEKLLKFLWDNKHGTPFEMAGMTIEIQAPIVVFREWHRHRTQSYNELSARYTQLPDLQYIPSAERIRAGGQSKANKQGAGEQMSESDVLAFQQELAAVYEHSRQVYTKWLEKGMAKELARLPVPVAQYSRMRASANLRNWLAFLSLRSDHVPSGKAAQWEIRQFANAVGDIVAEKFPRTFKLFTSPQ